MMKSRATRASDRKWVRHSLVFLAQALAKRRYRIGPTTVRRLLKKLDYGLFGNRQSLTPRHPDRERQFRFIRRVRKLFMATGRPVISVDTKKKELIGNFKNAGRDWGQNPFWSMPMILGRKLWDVLPLMVFMT